MLAPRSRLQPRGLGVVSYHPAVRLSLSEFCPELERRFGSLDFSGGVTPEIAEGLNQLLASLDVNDPALLAQLRLDEDQNRTNGYTSIGLFSPKKNRSLLLWAAGYRSGDWSKIHFHDSTQFLYEGYVPAVGPVETVEYEMGDVWEISGKIWVQLKSTRTLRQIPGDGQVYCEPRGNQIHRNGNSGSGIVWLISLYVRTKDRDGQLSEFHSVSMEDRAHLAPRLPSGLNLEHLFQLAPSPWLLRHSGASPVWAFIPSAQPTPDFTITLPSSS